MADVYTCDDYVIKKIEVETLTFTKGSADTNNEDAYVYTDRSASVSDTYHGIALADMPATLDFEYAYYVTVQRLPLDSYPDTTDIHIDRTTYMANLLPISDSSENFVNNVSLIVNTTLAAFDASFDGSSDSSVDKTGYTVKLGE